MGLVLGRWPTKLDNLVPEFPSTAGRIHVEALLLLRTGLVHPSIEYSWITRVAFSDLGLIDET